MTPLIFACAVAFGCITAIYIAKQYTKRTCPLPPGPPGLPWVGNSISIDRNAPWLTYHKWAKTYGDIVYVRVLNKDAIVINSEKTAKDLFDRHSSNNSDRPCSIINELSGLDYVSAFLPYGDKWRLHRRFFHQTFRIDAVQRFQHFKHGKACQLLRQLLSTPGQFEEHVSKYVISVSLNGAYDYDPPSNDDELMKIVMRVRRIQASVLRPDLATIINAFPILLKLPAWLPGMSFKTEMVNTRKTIRRYIETAFEYGCQRVRDGGMAPSMVHDALETLEEKGSVPGESWMMALKEASASTLGAGETSITTLMKFFLMMALHQEVQEKVQAQIDAVTGNERLPTLDDRPLLPLVDAILRETHRYGHFVPLSIPHAAVGDRVYRGFHIPKGAILIANVWSMANDESRYPNPHGFIPERFLNDDGSLKPNDIDHIVYGFGRRMCPGRHFADRSLWSVMAKVLAVFKILKPLDKNGVEMPLEMKLTNGLNRRVQPFKCRIVPRMPGMDSVKLEELIAASTA